MLNNRITGCSAVHCLLKAGVSNNIFGHFMAKQWTVQWCAIRRRGLYQLVCITWDTANLKCYFKHFRITGPEIVMVIYLC